MIAKGDKFELQKVPLTTGNEHRVLTKADFALNGELLTGKGR